VSFGDDIAEPRCAIMGLDLSPTASAAVTVPLDWDGRWSRIDRLTVGEHLPRGASDSARARRCETIATRLVAFARSHGVTIAWLEGYAFSRADQAHTIAEVAGVVRLELVRAGIEIRTVPASSARKLLLGKVPRSEAKAAVYAALRAAGAPIETYDEGDALAVANYGLNEAGGYSFAQSPCTSHTAIV
jgi:Holliday junction resolvasome RuvABC endonuclease subunit